jgi:hypothetical protein
VQSLVTKLNGNVQHQSKKKLQIISNTGKDVLPAPAPDSTKVAKVPKSPREAKSKPLSSSCGRARNKLDSLFMQFAMLERDGWNPDVRSLGVAFCLL